MTGWRLGRRPALDGLRGMAILFVLANHVVKHVGVYNQMGGAGVTLFFTLSGFLITSLLVEELADRGRISLRRFYERRARRLLPALVVVLVAAGTYLAVTGGTPTWVLVPLFYATNWFTVAGHQPPLFGHTWSLAVEEQFYLTWPLIVVFAKGRVRVLMWVCAAGIVLPNLERVGMWHGGLGAVRIYNGTDGHADALLLGCLLALIAHDVGLPRIHPAGTIAAVSLIAVFGALNPTGYNFLIALAVIPWLSAVAIAGCCSGRVGFGRVINWFGRRSYAIYLWHVPLIIIGNSIRYNVAVSLMAVGLSLVLAELSWRLVERRFLRRAQRVRQPAEPPSRPSSRQASPAV